MKKEYSKPTIEVLDMEVQQMICQSTKNEFTQPLTSDEGDEGTGDTAWPEYGSVFD